ncbi:phosphoribosyltransferase [Humibacter ginsenosidimutans]|uniref:Phosphoribosyltransferase n=1 Tax=Humibacter ginsenosidimutans TaxID=2599293 RepID=A0A5B8M256_9MICO|nr:phosphoribosyltransferase family protein [Humibacter ginsenosidimutans]QDZ13812.1 phosphoribosyltransferase [Humibacter ginsenosidimutans]
MIFEDRADAGRRLAADCLPRRDGWHSPIVLGVPRGGVPVAHPVAQSLGARLDVILVRKLGLPRNEEVAMGAIGEGVRVLDDGMIRAMGVTADDLERIEAREQRELERRVRTYRQGRAPLSLAGRTAVIVDDGLATGATARAACAVARAEGAASVVLAVPVAPPDWEPQPGVDADEFVCVARPRGFFAIGQWYHDFTQTTDDEVRRLLTESPD